MSEDLFLTASHCVDASITTKFAVFNFETAPGSSELLPQDHFKVAEIVEDGPNGLDYAIIRIDGKPGLKYGFTKVRPAMPEKGHLLTIIQHPKGQPKQVESGPLAGEEGNYMTYADLDTEPGSSGSGVLDHDGFLVGVHTNGGCFSTGGTNKGVKLTDIAKVSKVIQSLAGQPRLRR
ncbi:MAG: serine protease [Candidatus Sericytochromatia bacterium]